jgi:C-terminal processing protease CtpA/Prc
VIAGLPAKAAGIVVGDQILRVDGQQVSDLGTLGIHGLLDGEPDTEVKIDLLRVSGEAYSVTLRRQNRPARPLPQ